jgi:hypothetical protein
VRVWYNLRMPTLVEQGVGEPPDPEDVL